MTLRERVATYGYDPAGRLTGKTLPNGLKATYQYDTADRVTSIAYAKPDGTPVESVAYAYDAGGQRIAKSEGQAAPLDTTFAATYDEANRLATITPERRALPMGRRTEKTVNGQTTGFLYEGAQAIAEIRGGAFETVYHTGVQIDEVLGRYAASGNRTLLQDALMSVIAQANDAGNAENFYAYSPYGETAVVGNDDGNSVRYTAREDDDAGLYYYRARYYDPMLKRFISEDPIGLVGGINVYG